MLTSRRISLHVLVESSSSQVFATPVGRRRMLHCRNLAGMDVDVNRSSEERQQAAITTTAAIAFPSPPQDNLSLGRWVVSQFGFS